MKRDTDLVRLILLEIEKEYVSTAIYDLRIDGHDMNTVAYHCKILHDSGLISDYKAQYADSEIYAFGVGSLTWEGNDFLDTIRDDSQWGKIKDSIKKKGLPLVIDTIKTIASFFVTAAAESVANAVLNPGQVN